jgi:hypothetical protein
LVLRGQNADCAISFLSPKEPDSSFSVVTGGRSNHPLEVGRIRVHQKGIRTRFVAVAVAGEKGNPVPEVSSGPAVEGNENAISIRVEGRNFSDLLVWQPEEHTEGVGLEVSAGDLFTDGLLTLVRRDRAGRVLGYVLGDATSLRVADQVLVTAETSFSVSADDVRLFATGQRRARANLPPLQAEGQVRLLGARAEVFSNGESVRVTPGPNGLADLRAASRQASN